jgi:hypothetical protein
MTDKKMTGVRHNRHNTAFSFGLQEKGSPMTLRSAKDFGLYSDYIHFPSRLFFLRLL